MTFNRPRWVATPTSVLNLEQLMLQQFSPTDEYKSLATLKQEALDVRDRLLADARNAQNIAIRTTPTPVQSQHRPTRWVVTGLCGVLTALAKRR